MIPKIAFCALTIGAASAAASACPKCRPLVLAGIHNAQYAPHFGLMMLPLGLLLTAALAAYHLK